MSPSVSIRRPCALAPAGIVCKRKGALHECSLDRKAPGRATTARSHTALRAAGDSNNTHCRSTEDEQTTHQSDSAPTILEPRDGPTKGDRTAPDHQAEESTGDTPQTASTTSQPTQPKRTPEDTTRDPDADTGRQTRPASQSNSGSDVDKKKEKRTGVSAAEMFTRASRALQGVRVGQPSGSKEPQQDWVKQTASSMLSGALNGTLAVTLGWVLHINPLATFHVNEPDLAFAVAAAMPLIAIDYVVNVLVLQGSGRSTSTSVMLLPEDKLLPALLRKKKVKQLEPAKQATPGSESRRNQELIKTKSLISETLLKPKSQQTEEDELASLVLWQWLRAQGLDGGLNLIGTCPEVKVRVPVGCPQVDVVKEAMVARAERRALLNITPSQPLLLETIIIGVDQLGKGMFTQGFLLVGIAGWLTDRLYEAGMDDVASFGPFDLTLVQLSMLTYLGGMTLGVVIRDMRAIHASHEKLRDNHWRLNLMLLERGQWARQERMLYWKFETNLEKKFLAKKMKVWRREASTSVRNIVFLVTGNLAASVTVMLIEKITFAIMRRAVCNILKDAMNKQKETNVKTSLVTAEAVEVKQDSDSA